MESKSISATARFGLTVSVRVSLAKMQRCMFPATRQQREGEKGICKIVAPPMDWGGRDADWWGGGNTLIVFIIQIQ